MCGCRHGWSGDDCGTCPFGMNVSTDCATCALGFYNLSGGCECASHVTSSVIVDTAGVPHDAAAYVAALSADLEAHFRSQCVGVRTAVIPFRVVVTTPTILNDVEIVSVTPIVGASCPRRMLSAQCIETALEAPCIDLPRLRGITNASAPCVRSVGAVTTSRFSPCAGDEQWACLAASNLTDESVPILGAPEASNTAMLIGIIAGVAVLLVIILLAVCCKYCGLGAGWRRRFGLQHIDPSRNNLGFNIGDLADDDVLQLEAQNDFMDTQHDVGLPELGMGALAVKESEPAPNSKPKRAKAPIILDDDVPPHDGEEMRQATPMVATAGMPQGVVNGLIRAALDADDAPSSGPSAAPQAPTSEPSESTPAVPAAARQSRLTERQQAAREQDEQRILQDMTAVASKRARGASVFQAGTTLADIVGHDAAPSLPLNGTQSSLLRDVGIAPAKSSTAAPTLAQLAAQQGVSERQMMRANPGVADANAPLPAGLSLVLPPRPAGAPAQTVQQAAALLGMTAQQFMQANPQFRSATELVPPQQQLNAVAATAPPRRGGASAAQLLEDLFTADVDAPHRGFTQQLHAGGDCGLLTLPCATTPVGARSRDVAGGSVMSTTLQPRLGREPAPISSDVAAVVAVPIAAAAVGATAARRDDWTDYDQLMADLAAAEAPVRRTPLAAHADHRPRDTHFTEAPSPPVAASPSARGPRPAIPDAGRAGPRGISQHDVDEDVRKRAQPALLPAPTGPSARARAQLASDALLADLALSDAMHSPSFTSTRRRDASPPRQPPATGSAQTLDAPPLSPKPSTTQTPTASGARRRLVLDDI